MAIRDKIITYLPVTNSLVHQLHILQQVSFLPTHNWFQVILSMEKGEIWENRGEKEQKRKEKKTTKIEAPSPPLPLFPPHLSLRRKGFLERHNQVWTSSFLEVYPGGTCQAPPGLVPDENAQFLANLCCVWAGDHSSRALSKKLLRPREEVLVIFISAYHWYRRG